MDYDSEIQSPGESGCTGKAVLKLLGLKPSYFSGLEPGQLISSASPQEPQ